MAVNIRKKNGTWRQIFGAITVNILAINNGISAGWTSPVQLTLQKKNNPIQAEEISKDDFSWATSIMYVGGFLGLFVWNDFADRFGRKKTGYILAFTQIVGWLGVIFADHFSYLILARFTMGLGGTGIMTNSQLYINETAHSRIRGYLCSLLTIGMNFGCLLVNVLGSTLSYTHLNYVCLSVPVLFLFLYWILPETPLHLATNRRDAAAAKATLLWFNGYDESAAEHSLATLTELTDSKERNVPYSEMISTKQNALLTLVAVVLLSGMQICGMPVILAYTFDVFDSTKMDIKPHEATIAVVFIQLLVSGVSGTVVKCAGRKWTLAGSYFGAFFSLLLLAAFFYAREHFCQLNLQLVPLLSIAVFVICFGGGIGTVPYIVLGDMISPRILNNVVSAGLMSAIFISFVVLKIYPSLQASLGEANTFGIFASCNLLLALFVVFVVPNAKNIDSVEAGRGGARKKSKNVLSVNGTGDFSHNRR